MWFKPLSYSQTTDKGLDKGVDLTVGLWVLAQLFHNPKFSVTYTFCSLFFIIYEQMHTAGNTLYIIIQLVGKITFTLFRLLKHSKGGISHTQINNRK